MTRLNGAVAKNGSASISARDGRCSKDGIGRNRKKTPYYYLGPMAH